MDRDWALGQSGTGCLAVKDKMTKCTGPAQGRVFNTQIQFIQINSVKSAVLHDRVRKSCPSVVELLRTYFHSIGITEQK